MYLDLITIEFPQTQCGYAFGSACIDDRDPSCDCADLVWNNSTGSFTCEAFGSPETQAPSASPVSSPVSASPVTSTPVSSPVSASPVTSAPVSSPVSASPTSAPVSSPVSASPVTSPSQQLSCICLAHCNNGNQYNNESLHLPPSRPGPFLQSQTNHPRPHPGLLLLLLHLLLHLLPSRPGPYHQNLPR